MKQNSSGHDEMHAFLQVCLLIQQRIHFTGRPRSNPVALEGISRRDPFVTWQRHKAARKDMQDDGFGRFRAANRQGALLQQIRNGSGKV